MQKSVIPKLSRGSPCAVLVGTWWYWVIIGWYWLIHDGTGGSVQDGTGRYLVVLGQYGVVLVAL